jgi:hypothetical protein
MSLQQLSLTEVITDKPFTDLRHVRQDAQAIRYMTACVWLTLEQCRTDSAAPLLIHQPSVDRWSLRILLTRPGEPALHLPLTIVGFFGIRNRGADLPLAQELDSRLIPELSNYDELLGYVSLCLPTGNFGNLVLFASPRGQEQWGRSEKHAEAVRMLTPDFYAAVRLYNGQLPGGVADPDALRLKLVKYYDYGERPLWRAVRTLEGGPN